MTLGIKTAFDPSSSRQATGAGVSRLELQLQEAVERGVSYLLSLQAEEGYWLGELEADSTLESDYIFYLHVLGKADPGRIAKLANYIRRKQLPDGGWNIYPGGPAEINATVKAYFALKLAGDSVDTPHLAGARGKIHELGGLEATNSFTRFYLALVGAVEWEMVPAIPPELMLLPNWFYLNIYEMSSWTRGIVIPLAILYAHKPHWPLPVDARIDELFRDPSRKTVAFDWDKKFFTWRNFFLALDRALKLYERLPWKPLRQRALRQASQWLLEHLERSDGLGAIYPAMMNAVFALLALGHAADDPLTAREIGQLARFEIEEDDTLRVQPCMSPVWDTASHPVIKRAVAFLLHDQTPDGSWFGRWGVNYVYGTAGVLRALETLRLTTREYCRRGAAWLRAVQRSDGGFGELIASYYDPALKGKGASTPSQTAWGLIGLLAAGQDTEESIRRAAAYLVEQQNPDGSWNEQEFTGTGFPRVFYLKYHLYRIYFPLYALARYRNILQGSSEYRSLVVQPGELERRNGNREIG